MCCGLVLVMLFCLRLELALLLLCRGLGGALVRARLLAFRASRRCGDLKGSRARMPVGMIMVGLALQ